MKILLDEQKLKSGVQQLADQINNDYAEHPLTVIAVMTGSIVLLADLIRELKMPLRVGVVQASSYRSGTERGELVLNDDLMPDIKGRHVVVIDDIFDTGHTMVRIVDRMQELGPLSIKSAVLLSKTERNEVEMKPDYIGFHIPDEFVVGYGLDYDDEFRNLPFLAVLEDEDLAAHAKRKEI